MISTNILNASAPQSAAQRGTKRWQFYDVTITETLQTTVRVTAESRHEAERAVDEFWSKGVYELGAGDFAGVGFEAVPSLPGYAQAARNRICGAR